MDVSYEISYNDNQEEEQELEFQNQSRQIANALLQYLSSPNYSSEEKIDILLELLYRKNYDREDYQNYSLATLKNSINIEFEETQTINRTNFEMGDASKVLDGEVKPFIDAMLRNK